MLKEVDILVHDVETVFVSSKPKQMKYAALSSVFLYHLAGLSKPSIRASCTMLYRGVAAMFSHVLIKNSRTGIVRQTVGSRELENIWVALAGSYREKWLVNAENIMRQLHT